MFMKDGWPKKNISDILYGRYRYKFKYIK
jgi:hypothetical protein